jgi:hypothetical protein
MVSHFKILCALQLTTSIVVGLQYYHIAKIVLAISTPRANASGYGSLREGREVEVCLASIYSTIVLEIDFIQKTVRNHLRIVLGLAISNKNCQNVFFTARHALSVCK